MSGGTDGLTDEGMTDEARARLHAEAVAITAELVAIDSTNTGDPATIGDGETRVCLRIAELLDEVGITCNKNAIPYDKQKPFVTSGIRVGTPAVTTPMTGIWPGRTLVTMERLRPLAWGDSSSPLSCRAWIW